LGNLLADDCFENGLPLVQHGEFDATHDVSAMLGLGIEGGAHRQDTARAQIEQLRCQGSGAQINGNAKAVPGIECER
jgi:hypothetical protein